MSGEGALEMRRRLARRTTVSCPVCREDCFIRDSAEVTPLVKDLWIQCGNVTCGHTFKSQLLFVHVICPSALPHDHLDLPEAPPGFLRYMYYKDARAAPDPDQIDMFSGGVDPPGESGAPGVPPDQAHDPPARAA